MSSSTPSSSAIGRRLPLGDGSQTHLDSRGAHPCKCDEGARRGRSATDHRSAAHRRDPAGAEHAHDAVDVGVEAPPRLEQQGVDGSGEARVVHPTRGLLVRSS